MDTLSHKQFRKLLADHAMEHRIPLLGSFELTPLCNLDCKMCYVHLPGNVVRQRMLPGKDWISLIDEATNAGMFYAQLTGGEAMTHPDFWSIYNHLMQKGIRTQLKSNGVLLCGENLDRLRAMPPDAVDISLYGCDSDSYRAVTGHDVFEKVTENIRAIRAAGIPVRIMVTPSRAMMPWLEKILRLAQSFGTLVKVNAMLLPPREETERTLDEMAPSVEEYWQVSRLTREITGEALAFPDEGLNDKPQRPFSEKGLTCTGGRCAFTVRWNGQMAPCPGFPDGLCVQAPMKIGFAEAWTRMNQEVENFAIPEDCRVCDLRDVCQYCPTLHGACAGKHQCNQEYCSYKHRLENE